MITLPNFDTKQELQAYLHANKATLMAQKSYQVKCGDAVGFHVGVIDAKTGESEKATPATSEQLLSANSMSARLIINTTGLMDSHKDVHIPGIWKKNLSEPKDRYLLQEHQMSFKGIISDNVTATAKTMSWKSLGFNFEGDTQALVFDVEISKDRNEFMYEQYAKGFVKNHSVGMQYVKYYLCMDCAAYPEEKAMWDKYIEYVVNKDMADECGYFWAVTEAKAIEGSAVPLGSNYATPTQSLKPKDIEPVESTQTLEPVESTLKANTHLFT